MKNIKSTTQSRVSRGRRGVGAVVGGTMLAVILFTSVLIYFLVILQTENEKSKNEVQAARFDEEKRLESFIVGPITTVTDAGGAELLQVRVHNGGPLPLETRYVLVTSENPPTRTETSLGEIFTGADTSQRYLNPGETAEFLASVEGDIVDPDVIYKVDVISSRGNIISATFPPDSSSGAFNTGANIGDGVPVYLGMGGEDGTVLQFRTLEAGAGVIITDPGEGGNGITIEIDPAFGNGVIEDLVQRTGYVQLDFKSFSAIFPDFKNRDGVDQTGRIASSRDINGYPGSNLYGDVNTIIGQRLRNLHEDGRDIVLTKNTAVLTSFGGNPNNPPKVNYICATTLDADGHVKIPSTSTTYNDADGIFMQHVDPPYLPTEGWVNIYFCNNNNPILASENNKWKPDTQLGYPINPAFMVMRAKYSGTQIDYAQTIPYQAFQFNAGRTLAGFIACMYDSNASTACNQPTATATAGKPYKYSAPADTEVTRYIHIGTASTGGSQEIGIAPYYVELISSDGNSIFLAQAVNWNNSTNRNIPVTIPSLPAGNYVIKVSDSSNVSGTSQATMFMTYKVT
jgi:hypothetical protein